MYIVLLIICYVLQCLLIVGGESCLGNKFLEFVHDSIKEYFRKISFSCFFCLQQHITVVCKRTYLSLMEQFQLLFEVHNRLFIS